MKQWWLMAVFALVVAGCATQEETSDENKSERQLYETAQEQLKSGNFSNAVKTLQLLEARYPFGPFAEQSQLEIIYAYHRNFDHEEARAAADRFIQLHPQHPNVDYAYYLKGLASFTEGQGLFERFLPTDMTRRDPGPARDSFTDFSRLLSRYPNSQYAPDARSRMVYLRNLLARYEINVANYYFKRKAFLAAANRGRNVVEAYPGTPAVADGLAVMVQGYKLLGMNDLAENARKVLVANYPQHPSLDEQGNFRDNYTVEDTEPSLLNQVTLGLFDQHEPPEFNYDPTANGTSAPSAAAPAPDGSEAAEGDTEQKPSRMSRWFGWLPFVD